MFYIVERWLNNTSVCCLFQSLLQDISSHQRIADSVVEKAQNVLQSTSNPDVANFITEVSSRYETLAQAAKVGKNISRSLMSRIMRKPTFCICENRDADQLGGNREADHAFVFATWIV